MGNLFNALNSLKSNIFGAPSTGETTPILRKSAIELADTSPTSRMLDDPFAFASISYPRDLTSCFCIGEPGAPITVFVSTVTPPIPPSYLYFVSF